MFYSFDKICRTTNDNPLIEKDVDVWHYCHENFFNTKYW